MKQSEKQLNVLGKLYEDAKPHERSTFLFYITDENQKLGDKSVKHPHRAFWNSYRYTAISLIPVMYINAGVKTFGNKLSEHLHIFTENEGKNETSIITTDIITPQSLNMTLP